MDAIHVIKKFYYFLNIIFTKLSYIKPHEKVVWIYI